MGVEPVIYGRSLFSVWEAPLGWGLLLYGLFLALFEALTLRFLKRHERDEASAGRVKLNYLTAGGVKLNYLTPDENDQPLESWECIVVGIDRRGLQGGQRQDVIAKLAKGEPIVLIRDPGNKLDADAVALFMEDGHDIGYLPREIAAKIAPRLDSGSPVTASVLAVETLTSQRGKELLGVRLELTLYKMAGEE